MRRKARMRILSIPDLWILFICIFLQLTTIYAQTTTGQRYYPADSSFSILFPSGKLSEEIDTIETAIGTLIFNKVINKSTVNGKTIYTVISWTRYPRAAMHSDSVALLKDFWDITMKEAASSLKGEILYSASRRIGKWPAYTWKIVYGDEKRMDNLGILRKNILYLLQFSSPNSLLYTSEKEKFFNSFDLKE